MGSQEELDSAHDELVRGTVEPFRPKGKAPVPRRYKEFWTETLERKSKQRSRLYRKAIRTNAIQDWCNYQEINRSIRKLVRTQKRRSWQKFTQELEEAPESEGVRRISNLMRVRKGNARRNATQLGGECNWSQFTEHVARKFPLKPGQKVNSGNNFEVPDNFEEEIVKALNRAPIGKAAGWDETFAEALKLNTAGTAKVLTKLWRACGRCAATPRSWHNVLLYPIHKSGDRDNVTNFRPIALLSHVRKVITRALDSEIKKTVDFSWCQSALRQNRSIEQPLLRFQAATNAGHRHIAVLDIKGAYPSVQRGKLLDVLTTRLPTCLRNMVQVLLTTDRIMSIGDEYKRTYELDVGIPEGEPVSPTLFNLFIDTLFARLENVPPQVSMLPVNGFADDVLLMAKGENELQLLLQVCTDWAEEYFVYWAPHKSKVLSQRELSGTLTLAGETLERVEIARYLGVSISSKGITNDSMSDRMETARARVNLLRGSGLISKRIHVRRMRTNFVTFIRPTYEYAQALFKPSNTQIFSILELQKSAGIAVQIKTWRPHYRAFTILGLQHPAIRRKMAAHKLLKRLEAIEANEEYKTAQEIWMAGIELTTLREMYRGMDLENAVTEAVTKSNNIETKIKSRKIPVREDGQGHSLLSLKSSTVAKSVYQYYFGRFPVNTKRLELLFGNEYRVWKERFHELLSLKSWTAEEKREVTKLALRMMEHRTTSPRIRPYFTRQE